MSKKRKKKKPVTSQCQYCEHFHGAKKRSDNGKSRFCDLISDQVHSDQEKCSEFKLNQFIWCPEFEKWFNNSVCSQRHANVNPCKKCDVGAFVRQIVPTTPQRKTTDLDTHDSPGRYQKVELPSHLRPRGQIIVNQHTPIKTSPKRKPIILATTRTNKTTETAITRRQLLTRESANDAKTTD